MVKDGEDYHGLQTTNLKNIGLIFQDAKTTTGGSFKLKPKLRTTVINKMNTRYLRKEMKS